MAENRIDQVSIAQTTPRQTPREDFGTVLAKTAAQGLRVGTALLGGAMGGSPVLSAAVSGLQSVLSVATAGQTTSGFGSAPAGGSEAGQAGGLPPSVGGGQGEQWDLLRAQYAMQTEGAQTSAMYLRLQDEMQRESRQFNALSNVLKVRHDSAKAAINNIR